MDFPSRVYSAMVLTAVTISAEAQLLELQPNTVGTFCEILRIWISPDLASGGPSFEEARLSITRRSAVSTGGLSLTARKIQGDGESDTGCLIRSGATPAGSATGIMETAMSYRAGWVYLPHPDERIMFREDTSGFPNLSVLLVGDSGQPTVDLRYGVTWRELS